MLRTRCERFAQDSVQVVLRRALLAHLWVVFLRCPAEEDWQDGTAEIRRYGFAASIRGDLQAMDENTPTHTLFDRGRQLLELNKDDEALHCLRLAYAQVPHHARIRSYYGLALARSEKRFIEAVELCNASLKQEFFNPDLYYNAACVYMQFDFKADAIRCLKRGQMIDPSNKAIAKMLSALGMRKGPTIRFLPRSHRVNVWLGQARHRIRRSRLAAAA